MRVEDCRGLCKCWACGWESSGNLRVVFNGKSVVLCPNCLRELGDLIEKHFQDNWFRYNQKRINTIINNGKRRRRNV